MSEHCQSMGQKGSCLCEVCGAIRGGLPLRPARQVLALTGVQVALAGYFLRVRRIQRLYNQALCGKSKCPGQ